MIRKVDTCCYYLKNLENSKWIRNAGTLRTISTGHILLPNMLVQHGHNRHKRTSWTQDWTFHRILDAESQEILNNLMFVWESPSGYQTNWMCQSRNKPTDEKGNTLSGVYIPARIRRMSRKCFLTSVLSVHFPHKVIRSNAWKWRQSCK